MVMARQGYENFLWLFIFVAEKAYPSYPNINEVMIWKK
jgi:hypothetical protein